MSWTIERAGVYQVMAKALSDGTTRHTLSIYRGDSVIARHHRPSYVEMLSSIMAERPRGERLVRWLSGARGPTSDEQRRAELLSEGMWEMTVQGLVRCAEGDAVRAELHPSGEAVECHVVWVGAA